MIASEGPQSKCDTNSCRISTGSSIQCKVTQKTPQNTWPSKRTHHATSSNDFINQKMRAESLGIPIKVSEGFLHTPSEAEDTADEEVVDSSVFIACGPGKIVETKELVPVESWDAPSAAFLEKCGVRDGLGQGVWSGSSSTVTWPVNFKVLELAPFAISCWQAGGGPVVEPKTGLHGPGVCARIHSCSYLQEQRRCRTRNISEASIVQTR